MFRTSLSRATLVTTSLALLPSLAFAQGSVTKEKQGAGASAVKGAAGTEGSKAKGLEHCDKPMGAIAVVEPQSEYMMALSRYNLQSPTGLIRMMIQQSNCFIVVERGQGMRSMMQERELAGAGQTRANSNLGGGQMVAADFILTPTVVFQEGNAGGIGGAVAGGLLGRRSSLGAAVSGGLKFKEAQTSMLLADARSGVQVAAAEGSTRKADIGAAVGLAGGGVGGGIGAYGNTNEGKIVAAAYMDNYNKIVKVVRDDESLQRNVGSLKQEAAAGGSRKAGAVFSEGDVIGPKIANVKLLASPVESAKAVATLDRSDELVVIGDEKDGYIQVQGASASGWVRAVLVEKRQ